MFNFESVFIENIKVYGLLEGVSKIIVLFSGGKDISIALYYLMKYINDNHLKIEVKVILVAFPLHMYFDSDMNEHISYSNIKEFWQKQGVKMQNYVPTVKDVQNKDDCSVCKNTRKYFVDKYLKSEKEPVTIMSGYTLNDILAYASMIWLENGMTISQSKNYEQKYRNCLHKMHIKEYLPTQNIMIRPLINISEAQIQSELQKVNIPFLDVPCNLEKYKFKRWFTKATDVLEVKHMKYENILKCFMLEAISEHDDFSGLEKYQHFIDC